MKAWLVVHDYLPDHVGGTELHTHRLAQGLGRIGLDVTVLSTERDLGRPEGALVEREHEGVRVLERIHQREYADVRETWTQPAAAAAFAALLERERPDVVHFQHFAHWGTACLEVARAAGVPTVVTLHDYHLLCDNGFLLRPAPECSGGVAPCTAGSAPEAGCGECLRRHPFRDLGARASATEAAVVARERRAWHARHLSGGSGGERAILCPSRFLLDTFVASGLFTPEQLEVVEPHAAGPRRAPRRSDPNRPLRAAFVGGLYPAKGAHVFVEALRLVAPGTVAAALHGVIEWFPEYVGGLIERAHGLPVEFPGRFDPGEIDGVLGECDVLVVPSLWYENMPLAIQDAYRNGIPALASRLGGLREAVPREHRGLLFEPGDARGLADALGRLAGDREALYRLALACPAPAPFERACERTAALYERLGSRVP